MHKTAQIYFEETQKSHKDVVSLHIGIPRSARVGPGILSFDCRVSGFPNPESKVSGIPNMELRIPESYQKSRIPVSIPEVVQH